MCVNRCVVDRSNVFNPPHGDQCLFLHGSVNLLTLVPVCLGLFFFVFVVFLEGEGVTSAAHRVQFP